MNAAPWVSAFLDALRASCNVSASARLAGVSSSTVNHLRSTNADFASAMDEALEDAYDVLEAEARRRAFDGIAKPVVYQGQLTPLYEHDNTGATVMEPYDTGETTEDGKPIYGNRPKRKLVNGKPQYLTVTEYSDGLAQFLLKGYRRRKFGDKTEITGKDGGALLVDDGKRAGRIAQLVALATGRKLEKELG